MNATPEIVERSLDFAVRIVGLCRQLEQQDSTIAVLAEQLLRSATAFSAGIEAANTTQNKAETHAEIAEALKEGHNTRYWLRLIQRARVKVSDELNELIKTVEEFIRLLTRAYRNAYNLESYG